MNKLFPFFLFLGLSVFGADLPSTSYTRDFLRADTASEARGKLGIIETNMSVSLMPDATQFTTNSGILALVANPTNFLQNATPTHETLFTLPTDDPTKLGVLHPTVWYGATNWNGWRYWLFYSTWPGVEREAMFCAVSKDGTSWYPAPGTTTGQIGPNSADPEVVMLDDGSLCVYYLYAGVGGTTNNIDYLRSFDGVTWTTNRAFTVTNALAVGSAACPSIVRLTNNTYRMWWHDKTTNGDATDGDPYSMAQIYTMTSSDGLAWDLATKAVCPGMTNGWHFDVARIGDTLYMLRCNEMPLSHGPPKVWTSAASDGTNWTHVPGFGLVLPQGLVGPYRADLTPTAAWPPTFDVWWNNWDGYSSTADATNSTQRIGRMQGVTLPMQPLDWTRSNTLTMANSFFSSQSSSSTVMPFAYPWSVAGEGALNFKYVANLGTGGLLYTNAASAWGIFGLDAFGYKYDAAGSLGGGLFQSYETMPKSPSQFRIEWQVKLLTNSAAQIGVYKYGTFGSSVGTLTNIMVQWNTTGTNMAYLCVTNGSTSQRVAFDGVPSVAGTSHTLESTLVTIEKTEWNKVTAKLYRYPTTYTATATFADTTALWWTPFVAWKGTVGIERFDLRTKVNNARGGASDLPSSAVLSANAISMMTNGPITGTFVGDVVSSGVSQFADTTNSGSAYLSGPIHSYGGHVMHGGNLTAGSTDATFASVTAGTLTGDELSVSNITASGVISGDGSGLANLAAHQVTGDLTNVSRISIGTTDITKALTVNGQIGLPNNQSIGWKDVAGTYRHGLYLDNNNRWMFTSNTNNVYFGASGLYGNTLTPEFKLHWDGGSVGQMAFSMDSYGSEPSYSNLYGRRARGTKSSPTAVGAGDHFLAIVSRAYDGSAWSESSAVMYLMASEAWSTNAHGTDFEWQITPRQSISRATAMRLSDYGLAVSNTITASNLVASATGTTPSFKAGGTNGIVLRCPDGGSYILRIGNDGTLSTVTNSTGL